MYKKQWKPLTQSVVGGPDPGGFEAEHMAQWLSISNTERKYISSINHLILTHSILNEFSRMNRSCIHMGTV